MLDQQVVSRVVPPLGAGMMGLKKHGIAYLPMSTRAWRWLELVGSHRGIFCSKFSSVMISTSESILADLEKLLNSEIGKIPLMTTCEGILGQEQASRRILTN